MNWTGTRVLVTGAGGFIGSHLVEALVETGASVTAFIRYRSTDAQGPLSLLDKEILDGFTSISGDLRDADAVARASAGQQVVFHLGALIAIPYSYLNPVEVTQTNVIGTLNALMAARAAGVTRFVQASTSEVYGSARRVPIDETHPLHPQSPYAASKVAADALVASFHRSFDLPTVTVRPFNCFGPRQSGRAVIPAIAGQALRSKEIRLGALTPTRDFTYVTDTVAGLMALAASDAAVGQTVNVCSGKEIAIGELAERVIALTGNRASIVPSAERLRPDASEVTRLRGDATLAHRLTGWTPRVTLDEGLSNVIDFLRTRPDWTRTTYQI